MRAANVAALAGLVALAWGGEAHADAECRTVFDEMAARIESDYPGYVQAIAPSAERLTVYQQTKLRARREAGRARQNECTFVLRRFIAQFDDPHVFLLERPEFTAEEAAAHRARARRADFTRLLPAPAGAPLAGQWAAPEYDVLIARDGRADRYVAVVVAAHVDAWSPGDIAARFIHRGDHFEAVLYRSEDRAPIRYQAVLQRDGDMLHMPPITWGRQGSGRAGFHPRSPRAPFYENLGENAAVLTIPSFSPEHGEALSALISQHQEEVLARQLLIVDLRGNEGGSGGMGRVLAPFYHAAEQRSVQGPRPYPMAVSSPRVTAYYSAIRDQLPEGEERGFFDDFIRRMEAAPGRLVPYFEDPALAQRLFAPPTPQTVHPAPQHLAIIVDRHSVSAAEAFVLEARRSARVTVFGENTGGSIDYQNVLMGEIGAGALRHMLGLPLVAGSDQLPERGFNASGVPVDVPLAGQADWIAAVLAAYQLDR